MVFKDWLPTSLLSDREQGGLSCAAAAAVRLVSSRVGSGRGRVVVVVSYVYSPSSNLLMGAPKQKWTAEEEEALKAGVLKHGTGKWRNILSDPEFSSVLRSRSNVDLKDKWRNINATAIWGSRQKAKLALKRNQMAAKHDDNHMALITVPPSEEIVDPKPLAISSGTPRATGSKNSISRLENILLEAITSLREPGGSDRASIALYIEEKYASQPNLKKLLATKLKLLVANGTLTKVKHKYRIAPHSTISEARKTPLLALEGRQKDSTKAEKDINNILTKTQVDAELSRMKSMTAEEAAAAAAQAVAEAEVAIAEAEKAAREAEAAEAEAAKIFAKAAAKALKSRMLVTW
ncbi:Telomere repeat-binding factor 3 [Hibiscus syriacus]|uniref:MYB transcription factor n=3 Tax=Hibiscus syriacus TaxID=106335 RepID=A0A6A3ARW4_HIBSY|nr:Telomere repeat-binding factor 3 [Hibiscus syriacus]